MNPNPSVITKDMLCESCGGVGKGNTTEHSSWTCTECGGTGFADGHHPPYRAEMSPCREYLIHEALQKLRWKADWVGDKNIREYLGIQATKIYRLLLNQPIDKLHDEEREWLMRNDD